MNSCILHLGSNKGDRLAFLNEAIGLIIKKIGEIKVLSKVYETTAWGIKDQDDFLNQAAQINTTLTPFEILDRINQIESQIGRIKTVKWGPREIDIDIIFFNDLKLHSKTLEIPHAHYHKRRFVLVPLIDITSNLIDPRYHMSLSEIEKKCTDTSAIVEYIDA